MITLELTMQQHRSLLLVLLEYSRHQDHTEKWIDVLTGDTVTFEDLFAVCFKAGETGGFPT